MLITGSIGPSRGGLCPSQMGLLKPMKVLASDTSNTEALVGEAVCAQAPAQIPYVTDGTTLRFAISGNAFNVNFQSVYEFELN